MRDIFYNHYNTHLESIKDHEIQIPEQRFEEFIELLRAIFMLKNGVNGNFSRASAKFLRLKGVFRGGQTGQLPPYLIILPGQHFKNFKHFYKKKSYFRKKNLP